METKKDIGKVFKERLSELKGSPSNDLWENLEAELDSKKKKERKIVYWYRFSGILVLLLFLFFISKTTLLEFIKEKGTNKNETIISEQNDNKLIVDSTYISSFKQLKNNNQASTKVSKKAYLTNHKKSQKTQQRTLYKLKNNKISHVENKNQKETKYYDNKKENRKFLNNNHNLKKHSDSTSTKKSEEKHLKKDENLATKKSKEQDSTQENQQQKKWSVYPNTSLVMYNLFGKKSTNNTTINYGIYFTYLSSNKINFRIGLNNLKLKQTFSEDGFIKDQELSYIEIPLEFKHNFINNKIKPYYIGGVSYLFLDEAQLNMIEENNSVIIKNENDFNNSTISLNLGLGMQTKLYKDFYFNVEGFFKYQITPYKKNVDFAPYTLSLIGGIEYKF